ncbi:unnamed protein product [Pylaiella littoralis]
MSAADDARFDSMYLNLAQQNQGIDNLLESFFGFLRRKTDFYTGASEAQLEESLLKVVRRQKAIAEKEEVTKAKARALDEKKRAEKKAALAKKKAEQEEDRKRKLSATTAAAAADAATPAQVAPTSEADGGVVEVGKDGAFDVGSAAPTVEAVAPAAGTSSVIKTGVAAGDMKEAVEAAAAAGSLSAVPTGDGQGATVAAGKKSGGGGGAGGPEEDAEGGGDGDDIVEGEDDDDSPPPVGNGGKTENYEWTQTLQELSVVVPVPPGSKSRDVVCDISKSSLKVGVKGQPLLLDGKMYNRVIVDDSFWTLEDGKEINIALQKENQMEWWKCVVKGDPEINTSKVQPENSKLSELDGETRKTVEKMMFDQRQKAQGLPTADEMSKQEMLGKFMAQHPEMDFSRAKIS